MERLWKYQIDLRKKDNEGYLQGFTFIVATDDPQIALEKILRHPEIVSRKSEWRLANFMGPHNEVFYA